MNIQQLQYVLAVADSKNFEIAAERCFVTQSTLSTMVGRLEKEIGIRIFNRKTKPASITSEGERIIERFRIIDNEIGQFKGLVQELKGEMVGELKVGIIPTIAPYLLHLILPIFSRRFPEVKVTVHEIPTAQIIETLKNRSLDIGILALPIADPELVEQELYVEPFLVYDCRKGERPDKIGIHELDHSRLWLLQEGHCLRTQVQQLCDRSNQTASADQRIHFESGYMDSLLRFTKFNHGMTIVPYMAFLDFSKQEECGMIPFEAPVPSRSVGMLTHKFFVKKRLAIELQQIVQEATADLLPAIDQAEVLEPIGEREREREN